MYTQQLPPMRKLDRLVELSSPFPKSADEITRAAESHNLGQETVSFMHQFPADEIFESSEDFATRCYELNVLIKQEREAPDETLRSPQD